MSKCTFTKLNLKGEDILVMYEHCGEIHIMWKDVRYVQKMDRKRSTNTQLKKSKVRVPSARLSSTIGQDVRAETKLDSEWLPRLSTAYRVNLKIQQKRVYYLLLTSQDRERKSGRNEQERLSLQAINSIPLKKTLTTPTTHFSYSIWGYLPTNLNLNSVIHICLQDNVLDEMVVLTGEKIFDNIYPCTDITFRKISCGHGARDGVV